LSSRGVGVAVGDDEPRLVGAGGAVGEVALDQGLAGGGPGLAPVQAAGAVVGVEGGGHRPAARWAEASRCPGLGLAADGAERGAGMQLKQPAVGVASADRRQLVGIAEQDHLGAGALRLVKDAAELAGVDHARLVDQEDAPGAQGVAPPRPGVLEAGEGARGQACGLRQALGRLAG
jgi:hypothetical protein